MLTHEMIALHGRKAEAVAEARMATEMQRGDVAKAADWMAVLYEIRRMRGDPGTLN